MDPKTGRFLPVPPGGKPGKMLKMEQKLGVKFQDDYRQYYLSGQMSQRQFARRWDVQRSRIWGRSKTSPKNWIEMLGLPRLGQIAPPQSSRPVDKCEVCGASDVSLDEAHWVENAAGGTPHRDNLLDLCPNCHQKLDRGNRETTEKARGALLGREVRKLVQNENDPLQFQQRLLELCRKVLGARMTEGCV